MDKCWLFGRFNLLLSMITLGGSRFHGHNGREGGGEGYAGGVFLFFSNRVGCLGSLLISLAVTAVLLLVFLR
jgi:hypothetical protein